MGQAKKAKSTGGKCPICGSASDADVRPFCSKRCADVDLSRWLNGSYAIAGGADDDEDGDEGGTEQREPDRGGPERLQ